ncbi:MAG: hypothetical protein QOK05_699 [Chloroflexota bacterium]|jgi:hypothetical protein|nr:hypothetical protein [Chloroflexota bacterium]
MSIGHRGLIGLVAIVAAVAVAALPATGSASAPAIQHVGQVNRVARPAGAVAMTQSNNWSGYSQSAVAKGHTFSAITGDWIVPRATPHQAGEQEFSASWVGIGGGCLTANCLVADATLIQAGTSQDIVSTCGGTLGTGKCTYKAQYSVWFELIPAPSVKVNLPVGPGNRVHVDIHELVPNSEVWSITIRNISTGKSYQVTVPYSSSHATAEWIEETPVVCCPAQVGPLPNLGRVLFDRGTANGANPKLTAADAIQLADFNGKVLSTPSAPDADKDGFNACAYATACSPPGT